MKKIKTQTIPADFHPISSQKLETKAVSGTDFKKALNSVVNQDNKKEVNQSIDTETKKESTSETNESKKTSLEAKEESSTKEEETETIDFPLYTVLTMPTMKPTKLTLDFELEVESELAVDHEYISSDVLTETVISSEQLELPENQAPENIKQPVFILPEDAEIIAAIETPDDSKEMAKLGASQTVGMENLDTNKITQTSIIEPELETQVKRITPEKIDLVEPLQTTIQDLNNVEETSVVMTEDVSDSLLMAEEPDVEVNVTTEKVANETEIEVTESSEKIQDTDISASGQWTQMKLSAAQPQTQTETVKVIPQEQIVQEIETMIVEDLGDGSQVEKVSTTRIQLTPKHLGEMEIELVMKDKELTARLVVEKAETKQWLEQKLVQLTNTLAEQDIKVEQFDVEVSSNHTGFAESSMDEQSFMKEQERAFKQRRIAKNRSNEEQQTVPAQTERNVHTNTGRLSMWV